MALLLMGIFLQHFHSKWLLGEGGVVTYGLELCFVFALYKYNKYLQILYFWVYKYNKYY